MILLVDRSCKYCKDIDGIEKIYKNIFRFYVEDGIVDVNGEKYPLDPKISILPCLIDGIHYFMTVEPILEHLEKSGEVNATANIL